MNRRHERRRWARSVAVIESLEDRRLLSASVAPAVARVAHLRPFDDDGNGFGDSGGESGGDAGGDGGADDGGEGAGSTGNGGTSDGGEGAGGDPGANGGTGGDTIIPPPPADTDPTGGRSGPTTDSGGGTPDNGGGPVDDGGSDAVLYPTGDPYDDSLYDGGGTILVLPPAPRAADFGGALHVRLPAHPVAGDTGVATVDVFNTGGRATGRFELSLGVTPDGSAAHAVRVADRQVPVHLGHDRVAVYKVPFTLPATLTPGTYRFLALVDAGNAFAETDEADNVAVGPSVTIAAATSDLSVASAIAGHTARAGRPTAVAVHLRASGTLGELGTTTITVTATPPDGSPAVQLVTATRPVHLRPGGATTLRLRVTLPALVAGRYRLTVAATPVSPADANGADKSAVTAITIRA